LLIVWVLAILIIQPIADFPINDDFAYATNVYNLVVKHQFILHEFPSMNLISQTIYGYLFTKCFGFSFTALRLSILLLSIISSFVFKSLVKRITQNDFLATLFALLLFFNSLSLPLSFTYMTDMFFANMMILAIYQLVLYKQKDEIKHYVFFVFFCVVAVLNRQHGLIIPLSAMILLTGNKSFLKRILFSFIPIIVTWIAQDQYRHFLVDNHIGHSIKQASEVLDYIAKAPLENYIIRTGNSIVIIGLILLPIVLLNLQQLRTKLFQNIILYVITLFLCSYFVWYIRDTFPIGNINRLFECGPKLIKSGIQVPADPFISYIRNFQLLVGLFSFSFIIPVLINGKKAMNDIHPRLSLIFIFSATMLLLMAIAWDAYFDRYNIPVIVLLFFTMIPNHAANASVSAKVAAIISVVIILFSIAEVSDYLNWQKARWMALENLESKGIKADLIDGGFEYNGWHHPAASWSTPGKSWWWVKDDLFILASGRISNYEVNTYIVPEKLIPIGNDTIFVLKRIEVKDQN